MGGAGRVEHIKVRQLIRSLVMSSSEMIHTRLLFRATNVITTATYTDDYATVIKRDGGD